MAQFIFQVTEQKYILGKLCILLPEISNKEDTFIFPFAINNIFFFFEIDWEQMFSINQIIVIFLSALQATPMIFNSQAPNGQNSQKNLR